MRPKHKSLRYFLSRYCFWRRWQNRRELIPVVLRLIEEHNFVELISVEATPKTENLRSFTEWGLISCRLNRMLNVLEPFWTQIKTFAFLQVLALSFVESWNDVNLFPFLSLCLCGSPGYHSEAFDLFRFRLYISNLFLYFSFSQAPLTIKHSSLICSCFVSLYSTGSIWKSLSSSCLLFLRSVVNKTLVLILNLK